MKQYYLLELLLENDRINKKIIYKTEFTRPYCIIDILLDDLTKLSNTIYFVLTDNVDYLYKFFDVKYKDEYFEVCKSFYNKSNFAYGSALYRYVYHNVIDVIEFTIHLTSKNFNKYYSYVMWNGQVEYNDIEYTIFYKENKEEFSLYLRILNVMSKRKLSREEASDLYWLNESLFDKIVLKNKDLKNFNTFRELLLYCIKLYKKEFTTKHYKNLIDKEKLILNEYYDILMDVANGIEL